PVLPQVAGAPAGATHGPGDLDDHSRRRPVRRRARSRPRPAPPGRRRPAEDAGVEADAAVTSVPGAAIAVQTADCVPIALLADGAVGVVHAGWRGLAAGVVEGAVQMLREAGDGPVRAAIGPCIRARCYEFGASDLDQV